MVNSLNFFSYSKGLSHTAVIHRGIFLLFFLTRYLLILGKLQNITYCEKHSAEETSTLTKNGKIVAFTFGGVTDVYLCLIKFPILVKAENIFFFTIIVGLITTSNTRFYIHTWRCQHFPSKFTANLFSCKTFIFLQPGP